MVVVFILGYVGIAMEHPLKVNKAATALLLASVLWTAYILSAQQFLPANPEFLKFQAEKVGVDFSHQVIEFVTDFQIIHHVGEIAEILFFLLGAMTIVELVDVHGGFSIITDKITTKNKRKLLWIIGFVTFFLSAILDNMTTAIVITMLLRKLVKDQQDRWIFASLVILAANAGGAFSPIGDVTTIMLWIGGQVTTEAIVPELFLPSLISIIIPLIFATRFVKGEVEAVSTTDAASHSHPAAGVITKGEKLTLFLMGVGALIFVPVFKSITHLPPFLGILFGLAVCWVYTELLYHKKHHVEESRKARITHILTRIDTSTILFFLGILMAVAVLREAHILSDFAVFLDQSVGNLYVINIIIGMLSSVVDNVPLVAGAMGMYEIIPGSLEFAQNGSFWIFLAYCAGVGGSILIIGSAAGVVVMGLEKINFIWYMKKISLITLLGYLAGAAVYVLQMTYIFN